MHILVFDRNELERHQREREREREREKPAYTDVLKVSLRHILINVSNFLGIANSVRMLYKISVLTESY